MNLQGNRCYPPFWWSNLPGGQPLQSVFYNHHGLLLLSKRARRSATGKNFSPCMGTVTHVLMFLNLYPYNFSEEKLINNPTRWPSLEYPSIYAYLIDTPGEFTWEKLEAFKSLEAYKLVNVFFLC